MKYLHSWLQDYIVEKIPTEKEFLNRVSLDAFEVEEIKEIENKKTQEKDYVYEIKILPNRNHDCLGHYFMAKELSSIFNLTFKKIDSQEKINPDLERYENQKYLEILEKDFSIKLKKVEEENPENIKTKIFDKKSCTRFLSCKIKNIFIKESPDFLKYRLESIGQKSINNMVDITNYIQFTFNKPLHVYDAKKIKDYLECSFAKNGENFTTLDEKNLILDDKTLIIKDEEKILGLAGIKGGKSSGVEKDTSEIILESANFNPNMIRKTSQKYNLKTDASKRFENGLDDSLIDISIIETLRLIKKYATKNENQDLEIEYIEDNFPNRKLNSWIYKVSLSQKEINQLLGTNLSKIEIENLFQRLDLDFKYLSTKENLENKIQTALNKPYKNPSSIRIDAPFSFSCSSLISYLYEGIYMPSISIDKYLWSRDLAKKNNLEKITDLKFGDLIFTNTGEILNTGIYYRGVEYKNGEEVKEGVDHLGIYLGENKIIHSSQKLKNGTEIESVEDFLSNKKLIGFGRILENLEEERFIISIPKERLDLRIKEDIIEELARIYGLENIQSSLPNFKNKKGSQDKRIYFENLLKNLFYKNGFSEIYGYSLQNKGKIEILKSVAEDKNKLRENLRDGIEEIIEKNIFNLPLLEIKELKIFEFGNCFTILEDGVAKEWRSLCMAMDDGKKNKNYLLEKENILNQIKNILNLKDIKYVEIKNKNQKENCLEINFDDLILDLKVEDEYVDLMDEAINKDIKYKIFWTTPFIVRDVACWCGVETKKEDIEKIIQDNISALCVSINLFDEFEKDNKKSFAFRLIYQDEKRTLTDEEINKETEKIYEKLKENNFEIR